MGRLSTLTAAHRSVVGGVLAACAVLGGAACDEKSDLPNPTRDRSNAVTANGPEAPPPTAASKPSSAAPHKVCTERLQRPAPKTSLKAFAAADAQPPAVPIPFGVGRWVWVNLWAAWCGPCREEMPRLFNWRKQLAQKGVALELAFVSLDDDERQLHRFLDAQPPGGLRASYWSPDGESRYAFLRELGARETPNLPVQALVAPSGQVACVIEGAVEDADWPQIAAFIGAKP